MTHLSGKRGVLRAGGWGYGTSAVKGLHHASHVALHVCSAGLQFLARSISRRLLLPPDGTRVYTSPPYGSIAPLAGKGGVFEGCKYSRQ
jgi:hypothetical protein